MTEWNPAPAHLRRDLAGLASTPETLQERAEAVLQHLGEALRFDAAWLAVRDPEGHRHTPLATVGPAESLRSYFKTAAADVEVEQLGLNRRRPPVLASEIPAPLAEVRAWADHLLPAGFRGGLAAGLFTPGGRHVGFLSLLSDDPDRPSRADRAVIAAVTEIIADGLDRTRQLAETATIVARAYAGVVLTRGGDTLPLPGLPDDQLLAPGSRLLATAARELADSDTYIAFLAPMPATDEQGLVRVTALDCARPDLDHLSAVVLLSPPGNLHGLTRLDLRVLGLLVEGAAHVRAIEAALGVDERAVADSLDASLIALDATDLTAAAARAVRAGLRIPPRLAEPT